MTGSVGMNMHWFSFSSDTAFSDRITVVSISSRGERAAVSAGAAGVEGGDEEVRQDRTTRIQGTVVPTPPLSHIDEGGIGIAERVNCDTIGVWEGLRMYIDFVKHESFGLSHHNFHITR